MTILDSLKRLRARESEIRPPEQIYFVVPPSFPEEVRKSLESAGAVVVEQKTLPWFTPNTGGPHV